MAKTLIKETIKKPIWVKMKEEELIKIIEELSKKYETAEIGIILRDKYGIPTTKVYGKKLGQYLDGLKINKKSEVEQAEEKAQNLKKHLEKNITDKKAKHKLQKAQSRINVLRRNLGLGKKSKN